MQAVDRFDQLNQLFSLAKRHKFKKYYNLLAMALLDIALVNAEQHYFMVDGRNKHDEARYRFRKDLAQLFFDTKWEFFEPQNALALNNLFMSPMDDVIQDTENEVNPRTLPLGRGAEGDRRIQNATTCHPIGVMAYLKPNDSNISAGRSYRGSRCQVCAWEMRSNVTKHVAFCSEHGIRMCTIHRPLRDDSPFLVALNDPIKSQTLKEWYCLDRSATCWVKGHEFYIPLGIWGQSPRLRYGKDGCPRTISAAIGGSAYKKRSEWLLSEGLLETPPKARGRKRKKTLTPTTLVEANPGEEAEPINDEPIDQCNDDEDEFYDVGGDYVSV